VGHGLARIGLTHTLPYLCQESEALNGIFKSCVAG